MKPCDSVLLAAGLCLACTFLAVGLRVYARVWCMKAPLRSEDWVMILAQGLFVGFCAFAGFAISITERRNPIMTEAAADTILLELAGAEFFFMCTTIAFKLSLTIFFLRFLVQRWQRRIVYITGASHIFMSVGGVFLAWFQCGVPVHMARKYVEGRCIPLAPFNALLYTHGCVSALCDWVYAGLLILTIYRSFMAPIVKISASALIVLAVCSSIAALVRAVYSDKVTLRIEHLDPATRPTYYDNIAYEVVWAVVEMGSGITVASLACTRPFFKHCSHRWQNVIQGMKSSCFTTKEDDIEHGEVREDSGAHLPVKMVVKPKGAVAVAVLPCTVNDLKVARVQGVGVLPTFETTWKSEAVTDVDVAPVQRVGILPSFDTTRMSETRM